jgi:hypothetical protein
LGGDFQGIWVYRADLIWQERESEFVSALLVRGLDESAGPSLGLVAFLQSLLPFHSA